MARSTLRGVKYESTFARIWRRTPRGDTAHSPTYLPLAPLESSGPVREWFYADGNSAAHVAAIPEFIGAAVHFGAAIALFASPQPQLQAAEYQHGTHALENHQSSQSAKIWGGAALIASQSASQPFKVIISSPQESGEQQHPVFFGQQPPSLDRLTRPIFVGPQGEEDQGSALFNKRFIPPAPSAAPPSTRIAVGEQSSGEQVQPVFARAFPQTVTQPTLQSAEYTFGTHEAHVRQDGQSATFFRSPAVHTFVVESPPLRDHWFAGPQEDPTQVDAQFWSNPPASVVSDAMPMRAMVNIAPQQYAHQEEPRFWKIPLPSLEPGSRVAIATGQDSIDGSWTWFSRAQPPSVAPQSPPLRPHIFASPQEDPTQIDALLLSAPPPSVAQQPTLQAAEYTFGTHEAHVRQEGQSATMFKSSALLPSLVPEPPPLRGHWFASPQADPSQPDPLWSSNPPDSIEPEAPPSRAMVAASPQRYEEQEQPRFWKIPLPSREPGSRNAIPTGADSISGAWVWFSHQIPPSITPTPPPPRPIIYAHEDETVTPIQPAFFPGVELPSVTPVSSPVEHRRRMAVRQNRR